MGGGGWRLVVCGLLLLLPAETRGDVLLLKNGNKLEGRVRELPSGKYEVFLEPGQVFEVRAAEVIDWTKREAPYDEYVRRLDALDRDDHAGHDRLARWTEEKRLRGSARVVYRRLLRIDPHHAAARDRLGYVLHQNRWVRKEDLEDKGLVRFRGLWMSPEEVEAIRTGEAVEEFRRLLSDVHHDNRYLRENALLTIVQQKDPRLLSFVTQLLGAQDPVERLVAARVLGNFPYDQAGSAVQDALLVEAREEVRAAHLAALRKFKDPQVGAWLVERLRQWPQLEATARRNLLYLCEVCPYRDALPSLIDLRSEPHWGGPVHRTLERMTGVRFASTGEWHRWWQETGRHSSPDLGAGWL